jgi:hypothetical protein
MKGRDRARRRLFHSKITGGARGDLPSGHKSGYNIYFNPSHGNWRKIAIFP